MDKLSTYLKRHYKVDGWLDQYSAKWIADLSRVQCENGLSGSVGEIGIHMGRLFILLRLTAAAYEQCFAIDVFGGQHLNTDQSGCGDREIFLRNVQRWCGVNDDIIIIERSSLEVKPDELLAQCGRARLVSVDGGHTEECTINDLKLIEAILEERGVVILDDFYNQAWPAVAAGAAKYFFESNTKLRPFAVTPNKMFLAAPSTHHFYRVHMRKIHNYRYDKTVHMFGSDVDLFGCELWRYSMKRRLRKAISDGTLGTFFRRRPNSPATLV